MLVHAPARLDPEDHSLLVLSAVRCLVIGASSYPRIYFVLEHRACVFVRVVHGHWGAGVYVSCRNWSARPSDLRSYLPLWALRPGPSMAIGSFEM